MSHNAVHTDQAPAPAHTFPQGAVKGGLLQVSGQGPVDPATGEYVAADDVKEQTRRVLSNIEAILRAGDVGFADVLMLRVYLASRDDFAAMNEAYGDFLSERLGSDDVFPCRTTVVTGLPRPEMRIEIDALAAKQ